MRDSTVDWIAHLIIKQQCPSNQLWFLTSFIPVPPCLTSTRSHPSSPIRSPSTLHPPYHHRPDLINRAVLSPGSSPVSRCLPQWLAAHLVRLKMPRSRSLGKYSMPNQARLHRPTSMPQRAHPAPCQKSCPIFLHPDLKPKPFNLPIQNWILYPPSVVQSLTSRGRVN